MKDHSVREIRSFNAARGFVGGATRFALRLSLRLAGFNAARGFVGGATFHTLL